MNDIQKGLQTVVNKAWDDAQFKSDLVANPKSAIQSATGLAVPDNMNIVVNDQTDAATVYVNIPPKPDFNDMELTDEQLEQVSGGEVVVVTVIGSLFVGTLVTWGGHIANESNKKKGKKGW